MKSVSFLTLFLVVTFCSAQKFDQNWTMSYHGGGAAPWQYRLMFSFAPSLQIDSFITRMNFADSNGSISNSVGQLLFYTNGDYVADITGDTMFNGQDLNLSNCSTSYSPYGIPVPQSLTILPSPSDTNVFYIFHMTCDLDSSPLGEPRKLMYSTVDMRLNGGLGGIVQKNVPIFHDLLAMGYLAACKNGNGTDWWILVPQYQSNVYHRILLSGSGISSDIIQYGSVHPGQSHPGRAVFSPNGEWYARYDPNIGLSIMKFDRCTGLLSDELIRPPIYFPSNMLMEGGVEFSPSSRFLYVASILQLNQFDLTATNIMNSQTLVAQYDTFNCPFNVNLAWPTLAPDGKIYINSTAGNYCISYIDQPDLPGVACDVVKHGISLPMAIGSMSTFPNNPNFRLGYKDCSASVAIINSKVISVFPNPSKDIITLSGINVEGLKQIEVFTIDGRLVKSFLQPKSNAIDVSSLPAGSYLLHVYTLYEMYVAKTIIIR